MTVIILIHYLTGFSFSPAYPPNTLPFSQASFGRWIGFLTVIQIKILQEV